MSVQARRRAEPIDSLFGLMSCAAATKVYTPCSWRTRARHVGGACWRLWDVESAAFWNQITFVQLQPLPDEAHVDQPRGSTHRCRARCNGGELASIRQKIAVAMASTNQQYVHVRSSFERVIPSARQISS